MHTSSAAVTSGAGGAVHLSPLAGRGRSRDEVEGAGEGQGDWLQRWLALTQPLIPAFSPQPGRRGSPAPSPHDVCIP